MAQEYVLGDLYRIAEEHLNRPDFGTTDERDAAVEKMPEQVARAALNTVTDALTTADAASIVFAHSMLDSAAADYCKVTSILDPEDWIESIKEKTLTFEQVFGSDKSTLLREMVARYMVRLEKETVLKKIEALQRVCKPGKAEILPGYKFDGEKLKAVDDLRHGIVHEAIGSIESVDKVLEYLEKTERYLSCLVTYRFGIYLGPELFKEATR